MSRARDGNNLTLLSLEYKHGKNEGVIVLDITQAKIKESIKALEPFYVTGLSVEQPFVHFDVTTKDGRSTIILPHSTLKFALLGVDED